MNIYREFSVTFTCVIFLCSFITFLFPLGLVLEMNVEQNEYLGDLTRDAGIRVQIEDKRKVPFPYEKGFSVGPGSATSVGIRKVSYDKEINLLIYNMYI